jgi:hypothetical protein
MLPTDAHDSQLRQSAVPTSSHHRNLCLQASNLDMARAPPTLPLTTINAAGVHIERFQGVKMEQLHVPNRRERVVERRLRHQPEAQNTLMGMKAFAGCRAGRRASGPRGAAFASTSAPAMTLRTETTKPATQRPYAGSR